MRKRNKRKNYIKKFKKLQQPIPVVVKEPSKTQAKILGIKAWKVILGFIALIGLIANYTPIRELFMSPKEKYDKETFVEGDLKPSKLFKYFDETELKRFKTEAVFDSVPPIKGILIKNFENLNIAVFEGHKTKLFPIEQYYFGFDMFQESFRECFPPKVILGVKGERLYVSAEFKDLHKEETIGFIEFNHWKLYKPNMLDFYNDDKSLIVKDKQNNIAFSIKYEEPSSTHPGADLIIQGYFISPTSVLVLRDVQRDPYPPSQYCFLKNDSNWKRKALVEIQKIKGDFGKF